MFQGGRSARYLLYLSSVVLFGAQPPSSLPIFEVASLKPNPGPIGPMYPIERGRTVRYSARPLRQIMSAAYDVRPYQIFGSSWIDLDHYDVTATPPPDATTDDIRLMLQSLLIDRFRMKLHREKRMIAGFFLEVGKGGLKLRPLPPEDLSPAGRTGFSSNGSLEANSLEALTRLLTRFTEKPVLDMTGIRGRFDIRLEVAVEDLPGIRSTLPRHIPDSFGGVPADAPRDTVRPSLFAALGELGLRLVPRTVETDVIVIDNAEKVPLAN